MIINEIDWRIEPLHAVIVGIDAGLKTIQKRMDEEDGFDGLCALEHADTLLGVGFVAAQAYTLGTWTDINRVRTHHGRATLNKRECYATDPVTLRGGVTRIQLVDATANYFKHHDEWSEWRDDRTTQILGRVGVTKATEFPCVQVAHLLCGDSWQMIVLHQIVKEWRAHISIAWG